MPLLGIDLGTAHCKAAIFQEDGHLVSLASRLSGVHQDPAGFSYYAPGEVWDSVKSLLQEVLGGFSAGTIAAVGISSMAETGLLVDISSGEAVCPLLPWFDPVATPQAERLADMVDPFNNFTRFGISPNFKCALSKLLWLRDHGQGLRSGLVWLSCADWLAYLLTGNMTTDYSLACRSYAFRLDQKTWDAELLQELNITTELFPSVRPSGTIVGKVTQQASLETGLVEGTPVAVCGHDHICATFASGAIYPGQAFDSMGTAEALIGPMDERLLTRSDFESGLNFGIHVAPGRMYWLGGLSTSGGSLEWLRSILGDPVPSYEEIEALQSVMNDQPGDILFYPYLAGSGSPHTDLHVRGSFLGLTSAHRSIDLLKAVFEGTAYEVEFIRRTGEQVLGTALKSITAAGGGTRNRRWMQIKADISGCRYTTLKMPEATLAGAALLAGIGQGVYPSPGEALKTWHKPDLDKFEPDPDRHLIYAANYSGKYIKFQGALREFHRSSIPFINKAGCND